jgi:hypothetical protein
MDDVMHEGSIASIDSNWYRNGVLNPMQQNACVP